MIRANRAALDEHRTDIDTNSQAIDAAHSDSEPARIAAFRPATIAKAANGCGLRVTGDGAFFEKCNVHVQSGSGSTSGTINGFGNLIVGYDEPSGGDKTGSHTLIVGPYHSYPSFGGFIAGRSNSAIGSYSSVSGGSFKTVIGDSSSVSGGRLNTASGSWSSVLGGEYKTAINDYSIAP